MNSFQRLRKMIAGFLIVLCGAIFLLIPDQAYILVAVILAAVLAVRGLKDIIFYFSSARYMVGGKVILFQGVIMLDLAMLAGSLTSLPGPMVLLYLIIAHAFSGVVEILRAKESQKAVNGSWKLKFSHGVINILLALICLVMIQNANIPVLIFGSSLIYSGVMRVIDAFRRTTFILIE